MSTAAKWSAIGVSALVVASFSIEAAAAKEKRCRRVCEERTEYESPPCEQRTRCAPCVVERRTVYVVQPEVAVTPVVVYPAYSYGDAYPYGYADYGGYGAGYLLVGASYGGWGW